MDKLCILCKKSFKGHGNNAEPLANGICCELCNIKVIKSRMEKTTRFTSNFSSHTLNDGTLVIRQVLPDGHREDSVVLGSRFTVKLKYLLYTLNQKFVILKKDFKHFLDCVGLLTNQNTIENYLRGKSVEIDFMHFINIYWQISHKKEVNESSDLDLLEDVDQEKVYQRFIKLAKIQIDRLLSSKITPTFILDDKPLKKQSMRSLKRTEATKRKRNVLEKLRSIVKEKGVIVGKICVQHIRRIMEYDYIIPHEYSLRALDMMKNLL